MTDNNNDNNGNGDDKQPFGKLRNIADIDDIVTVDGFAGSVFQVEGWTHERGITRDGDEEMILYDVTDLETQDFLIAFQEDITVVTDTTYGKGKTEEAKVNRVIFNDFLATYFVGSDGQKRPRQGVNKGVSDRGNSNKGTSDTERIDRLLTEISDYNDLIRNFGDAGRKYGLRICEAKAKLKEITKGGV